MKKFLTYLGNLVGGLGTLLLLGCFVAWSIGLNNLTKFYEENQFLVYCALAGIALIASGIFLQTLASSPSPTNAPSGSHFPTAGEPEQRLRCGKCEATNRQQAKFCDQCGLALTSQ